jgi:60 kDa SS-A/Ro ribonucleoprotein
MAKLNVPIKHEKIYTHEGAPAVRIGAEQELRRSLMCCMLWENSFYESGMDISERIASLIPEVEPWEVGKIAADARSKYKLRHAPLLVAREMARYPKHKLMVADVLEDVIQRADELAEYVAIYWEEGRKPLSAQSKKGLAKAFTKFSEYDLGKYNRDGAIKLRDVLFLCHAKPKNAEQEAIWKRLIDGTLEIPDTWEVSLSTGKDKKETWERLLSEKKLGALALLRNLRNMKEAGVESNTIFTALGEMKTERVLPFRFITAARYAPQWEAPIEKAMLKCLDGREKLPGKTVLLIDVSGSMDDKISDKSELTRIDAAAGLAILARELCESGTIYTFSSKTVRLPDRRGFALRDAIFHSQPHMSTMMGNAIELINREEEYDRIIVFTDEQSHQAIMRPKGKGYVINVASYQNGIGYGAWTHIDGFSESVFDYIIESEKETEL